ncbi:hypothetical protein GDO78_020793 [Eleutherodactylus coqui]|uniref:BED-type domain-containing protein n=1 Tax=Eleutherodactylus coqui TaxID=57060 RepID=A0A8J6BJG6_ELECQ|nr:hypothetical protein GDO78_020793 [Eleutherodactylus coqui]
MMMMRHRVSVSEVVVRALSPREERTEDSEEEQLDDEVTDPTWFAKPTEDRASEGEASVAAGQVGRGSGVARGRGRARAKNPPTVSQSTTSRQASVQRARCSKVWMFFSESADDRRTVVCSLCCTKISLGATTTSLTTTSMRRHMMAKHPTRWDEGHSPPPGHTTASYPVLQPATQIQSPSQDTGTSASRPAPTPSPPLSSTPSSNVSQHSFQLSLTQALERKRKYAAKHLHAQALNVHIAKLISLEMLPYRLVEMKDFRNMMAAAVPRYSVPSHYYFSRCAVPALHQHVSRNINRALTNAVTGKVHLTTDTWTRTGGQGHYISLTAHWVNLVEAGTESEPGTAHVLPTPRIAGPTSVLVSAAFYATSSKPFPSSSSANSTSQLKSVSTSPAVGIARQHSGGQALRLNPETNLTPEEVKCHSIVFYRNDRSLTRSRTLLACNIMYKGRVGSYFLGFTYLLKLASLHCFEDEHCISHGPWNNNIKMDPTFSKDQANISDDKKHIRKRNLPELSLLSSNHSVQYLCTAL